MSLVIDKKEIYNILSKRKLNKNKNQLLEMLKITKKNFYRFTEDSKVFFEKDKEINPIMWQIGHVIFFIDSLILFNLQNCKTLNVKGFDNNYDSFITPVKFRNNFKFKYGDLSKYFLEIISIIENYILNNKIETKEVYLILLGIQ